MLLTVNQRDIVYCPIYLANSKIISLKIAVPSYVVLLYFYFLYMYICQDKMSISSVTCSCCSLLIVGKLYIGPMSTGDLSLNVFPLFFIIQYTMILVITDVMSPVNRPVIGTAIATECVCV